MSLRSLVALLADGGFHTGRSLALALGVTRPVIVRQMQQLRSMGIEVHSVTGKGYRLPVVLEMLEREKILALLGASRPAWERRFEVLFSTRSTNADALLYARTGGSRYLFVAEHQSAGRGRRGRTWVSPLGANISMSMLWTFNLGMAALGGLSLVVAILLVDALKNCGYSGFGVKWPNDILLDGGKLAGILVDITGDAVGPCKVVIGIGINVRVSPYNGADIDQPYADLSACADINPDRNRIVAALALSLESGLTEFARSGFAAFMQRWNDVDVYKGRLVEIVSGANRQRGVSLGVNESGALLLQTDAGVMSFSGGEVAPSLRVV